MASGASVMGVVDLFAIANRIAGRVNQGDAPFNVRVLSEDGEPVQCSNGYQLSVDGKLSEVAKTDIIYLAAFSIASRQELDNLLPRWKNFIPWFSEFDDTQELITSSCSGSFLLAEAGLLNGKTATSSWWLASVFVERYPAVKFDAQAICTESGNIICGAGTSSYQDVCLLIVERYAGKHFSRLLAKYLMIDNQRRSQALYVILSPDEHDDKVVAIAQAWIRKNLNQDFSIEQLADVAAVSSRTLIRRFQNSYGDSPQAFIQKLRIEKCKTLLETTQLTFAEIVVRCGYRDESAFRRLFKRYCQLSPNDYRRRFTK